MTTKVSNERKRKHLYFPRMATERPLSLIIIKIPVINFVSRTNKFYIFQFTSKWENSNPVVLVNIQCIIMDDWPANF